MTELAAPRPPGLTVVLVGRPNSGKSSLYNRLTGGTARVGNFPGVTVDILEGAAALPDGRQATVTDVPGVYTLASALAPDSDEAVTRRYLEALASAGGQVLVAQVLDVTHLALGLRLTRELLTAGLPVVVLASHMDALQARGFTLDAQKLSRELGVPVLPTSAKARTVREDVLGFLARAPLEAARPQAFHPDALAREVTVPVLGLEALRAARGATARLDAVLLHPLLGPVVFLGLMALLFAAVFLVADPASQALEWVRLQVAAALELLLGTGPLAAFVTEGLLGGAGTVLTFLPQIVILTVAMELLDASGYLARGAFLVDRLFRVLGLSGRSFLPLLMGHACAVPAINATRIIRDPGERLAAVLAIPLMTCSARLPTYALLVSAFFTGLGPLGQATLFLGLYGAGLASGLLAALVLRRGVLPGRPMPLVLEMPPYRMPEARVVLANAVRVARRFVVDVGTVILVASAVLWLLLKVPVPGAVGGTEVERSVAAQLGKALEPVTAPAGFDWRINVGLIGSFGARELMVGTLGVIFEVENAEQDPAPLAERLRGATLDDGAPRYGPATALALMAFFVLACQCMSTVAAIRRETGGWLWPAVTLGWTYTLAFVAAVAVRAVARAAGLS